METGYIIGIVVTIAIIALILLVNRNRINSKNNSGDIARGGSMLERVNGTRDKRVLPSGLKLWVEAGATDPNALVIETIEKGILDCFAKGKDYAEKNVYGKWDKAMSLHEYTVAIVKSDRRPQSNIWAFQTPDWKGSYNDTEFDQVGDYIYATEQVLNYGGRLGNIFCVADPHGAVTEDDKLALYNAAMYGTEHVLAYHNDMELYKRTEVHIGSGHPIF